MANVNFKRGDTATMNATAISDGLIFLNTENNKIYFDNGSTRLQFGGDTTLISSVDDADVDNAFNASATVNLFAQKNSIVDTKANALAVTQPKIPLGCLAFKEAVGTTNISTIGDGTLSGAISTLNSGKVNTNLNNVTGTLPINRGGTGATDAGSARTNLGLGNSATHTVANNLTTTSAGYVLDARQGQALYATITANHNTLGGEVNIATYTSSEYTCPGDGYIIAQYINTGRFIFFVNGAKVMANHGWSGDEDWYYQSLFVKKGSKIKTYCNNTVDVYLFYRQLN